MTNQNDTQDEAERIAINKIAGDVNLLTKIHCLEIPEVALALKKAYRAGVASKEAEIADLNVSMDECFAKTREMIREASKAKTRDSFLKANIELSKELAAEKQKALKLVEALQIYANRVCEFTDDGGRVFYKNGSDNPPALPFYSGEQWELGHHAEKALADYSTDSGDGGEK